MEQNKKKPDRDYISEQDRAGLRKKTWSRRKKKKMGGAGLRKTDTAG